MTLIRVDKMAQTIQRSETFFECSVPREIVSIGDQRFGSPTEFIGAQMK